MKILLSWLNDYVQTGLSAGEIAELLSDAGFPNEGIEYIKDDAVIDLEVTSNRGDALGHIGVARELAAITGKELNLPEISLEESDKDVSELCGVEIQEPDLCGRYTARVIKNVTVGPSPQWLVDRLEAIGLRSVNNVVDATNYAMMETGQPPHAFDYDKIIDGRIVVRKAKPGEQIISIDGSKCDLQPDMLVIADSKTAVAVAGVMGGLDSEVSNNTKNILLEDAYFDPVSVRATSRALTLPSDASFRFERIVDIENIDWASRRTSQLIVQVAGGKVARGVVDVYPKKPEPKQVQVRLSRINHLLGIEVPADEAIQILRRLCLEPKRDGDVITCIVPTWRSDIYREVDLVEEVARIYGYNKVPLKGRIEIEIAPVDKRGELNTDIGQYLNGCGFYETINVSFVNDKTAKMFSPVSDTEFLGVKDVSRKSANILRPSLVGSLMEVLKTNNNVGNRPCRIFEIADTFVPTGKGLPLERAMLGLACDSDMRDVRGVIEGLIANVVGDSIVIFQPCELSWAEVGADILINGQKQGIAGMVSQDVRDKYGLKEVEVCAAQIDVQSLLDTEAKTVQFKAIPRFPAVDRDLSLIVDEQVTWDQISGAVNKAGCEKLEQTNFVGIYRGKGIDPGKKSLTLTLRFRDEDGTLTHEQVDELEKSIVSNITKATKAVLRKA